MKERRHSSPIAQVARLTPPHSGQYTQLRLAPATRILKKAQVQN